MGQMRQEHQWGTQQRSQGLVDVLDRVLDKGLVIAGDIKICLAEVELLTIRIRLIVCSLDKAQEVGIDWWKYDQHLSAGREPLKNEKLMTENESLRKQIHILERKVEQLSEQVGRLPSAQPRLMEPAGHRAATPPTRPAEHAATNVSPGASVTTREKPGAH